MKKQLSFFCLIITTIFFCNFGLITKTNFILTNEVPQLPAIPYDYSVDIPAYLKSEYSLLAANGRINDLTEEITDDKATLGRVLFYDKSLSSSEKLSCASCHSQKYSFSDDASQSRGVDGRTKRNSMHLNDLGWTNNEFFFWDMKSKDLKAAITLPLTDENEIAIPIDEIEEKLTKKTYYDELFFAAYGEETITGEKVVDALAAFILSINSFNTKFDQGIQDGFQDFTFDELMGFSIFEKECNSCHAVGIDGSVGRYSNSLSKFSNRFINGMTIDSTDLGAGIWNEDLNFRYKVPTLRNVAFTAPYMHDGSLETLDEVIDFYSDPDPEPDPVPLPTYINSIGIPATVRNQKFSDREKVQLKAFLLTLSDETSKTNPKWSDPFVYTSSTAEYQEIESLNCYPNPTQGYIVVEFENRSISEIELTISDMSGRILIRQQTLENRMELDCTSVPKGLYLLKVASQTASSSKFLSIM